MFMLNFFLNFTVILLYCPDRRPVYVDLWTSVPSYELEISRVPRTVIATNKTEDLNIFLEFSDPVMNSTEDIMNVLHANAGYFSPLPSGIHGNRRFGFEVRTETWHHLCLNNTRIKNNVYFHI